MSIKYVEVDCPCPCHNPGSQMMHCFPCCVNGRAQVPVLNETVTSEQARQMADEALEALMQPAIKAIKEENAELREVCTGLRACVDALLPAPLILDGIAKGFIARADAVLKKEIANTSQETLRQERYHAKLAAMCFDEDENADSTE